MSTKSKKFQVPDIITSRWLSDLGACSSGLISFHDTFKNGTKPTIKALKKMSRDDINWLASEIAYKNKNLSEWEVLPYNKTTDIKFIMDNITWPNKKYDDLVLHLPKYKVPYLITSKWIKKFGPCVTGFSEFNKKFPNGLTLSVENFKKCSFGLLDWISYKVMRNCDYLIREKEKMYFQTNYSDLLSHRYALAKIIFSLITW